MRLETGEGSFKGNALVDTGSALTIISRNDLRFGGFPVEHAMPLPGGIAGIGGRAEARYFPSAIVTAADADGALHSVNLPRLFMTDSQIPPILGREVLKLFNAVLHLDFHDELGWIDLG